MSVISWIFLSEMVKWWPVDVLRLIPVFPMVHILRWNIREKFKLLSDLKDFEPWFPMIPKLRFFGLKLVSIHEQLWLFQVISKKLLYIIEGSLNSKLPTIWRVEKQMKSR